MSPVSFINRRLRLNVPKPSIPHGPGNERKADTVKVWRLTALRSVPACSPAPLSASINFVFIRLKVTTETLIYCPERNFHFYRDNNSKTILLNVPVLIYSNKFCCLRAILLFIDHYKSFNTVWTSFENTYVLI